jgi:hypothetical protein
MYINLINLNIGLLCITVTLLLDIVLFNLKEGIYFREIVSFIDFWDHPRDGYRTSKLHPTDPREVELKAQRDSMYFKIDLLFLVQVSVDLCLG